MPKAYRALNRSLPCGQRWQAPSVKDHLITRIQAAWHEMAAAALGYEAVGAQLRLFPLI